MNPWRTLRGLPRPLYVLAAATLINRAGSMVVVLLALYLTRGAGLGAEFAGIVVTTYGATQLVTSPVVGRLCDRYGARSTAITMLALSGVGLLLYPLVESPAGILLATVGLAAVTEGFRPATMTLVSQLVRRDQLKTAFSLQRLAANLGMSVGPALGGLLATWWFPAVFIVDGITSLVAALVLVLALEPKTVAAHADLAAGQRDERESPDTTRRAYADPAMLFFLVAHLGTVLVFFQFSAALPLYMVDHLGLSERAFGLVFTVNTLLIIALQVPINAATEHWSPRWSMTLGALLVAVGFGATGLATGFWTMMATVVVWTFGEILLFPSGSAYVAELAPAQRTGEYMGLFNMLFGVGFTVGPWAGVALLERCGADVLWSVVAAGGLTSVVLLAFVRRPPARKSRDEEDAATTEDAPPPSSRPLKD